MNDLPSSQVEASPEPAQRAQDSSHSSLSDVRESDAEKAAQITAKTTLSVALIAAIVALLSLAVQTWSDVSTKTDRLADIQTRLAEVEERLEAEEQQIETRRRTIFNLREEISDFRREYRFTARQIAETERFDTPPLVEIYYVETAMWHFQYLFWERHYADARNGRHPLLDYKVLGNEIMDRILSLDTTTEPGFYNITLLVVALNGGRSISDISLEAERFVLPGGYEIPSPKSLASSSITGSLEKLVLGDTARLAQEELRLDLGTLKPGGGLLIPLYLSLSRDWQGAGQVKDAIIAPRRLEYRDSADGKIQYVDVRDMLEWPLWIDLTVREKG